jgi:Rrf2 family protein
MKLSAQEEYGLRCLVRVAQHPEANLTIPEIAEAEGIAAHNVAKYLRMLRQGGFVDSERGQNGGYSLASPPDQISLAEVIAALGGRLFDPGFCDHFAGLEDSCHHSAVECSIKGLWGRVQSAVDEVLSQTTLSDLLHPGVVSSPEELIQVSVVPPSR